MTTKTPWSWKSPRGRLDADAPAGDFVTYGVEPRALKIGDRYVDEELMLLDLRG